jgi:hypothetical protein
MQCVCVSPCCVRSVRSRFLQLATVLYTFHTVFGRLLCVYILLNKLGSRCTIQGIADLRRQLTIWSSERNPVVKSRSVYAGFTSQTWWCNHEHNWRRQNPPTTASHTKELLPGSWLVTHCQLQGRPYSYLYSLMRRACVHLHLCPSYYLSTVDFHGTLQRGNVSNYSATDTAWRL